MRHYRNVIRITAEDSPNIRYGKACVARGERPKQIFPTLSWDEYQKHLATLDEMERTIVLDAQFYRGAQAMWFAEAWLRRATDAELVRRCRAFPTEAIGCDPAEGADNTTWSMVNRYGVKNLLSRKTKDTSVITAVTLALGREHNVPPEKWWFDRGGGGQQHADALVRDGYGAKTVGFADGLSLDPKRGMTLIEERIETKQDRYVYRNRRAEMYHGLAMMLDPAQNPDGYAIPDDSVELRELRRQLSMIPKLIQVRGGGEWSCWDKEGRLRMLPKNRDGITDTKVPTLCQILGCSPDEADATVIAEHARTFRRARPTVTAY